MNRRERIAQLQREVASHDAMLWTTPLLSQRRHEAQAEIARLEAQAAMDVASLNALARVMGNR